MNGEHCAILLAAVLVGVDSSHLKRRKALQSCELDAAHARVVRGVVVGGRMWVSLLQAGLGVRLFGGLGQRPMSSQRVVLGWVGRLLSAAHCSKCGQTVQH